MELKKKSNIFFPLRELASSSRERREMLKKHMSNLSQQDINCEGCAGNCCTFTSNSMKITPIEALDIIQFLVKKGHQLDEVKSQMKRNIKEFRLDIEPPTFGKKSFRKTYTCPFFKNCSLGCSISASSKPYGCLAFNPLNSFTEKGENCRSNQSILKERDDLFFKEEESLNKKIRSAYHFDWEKLPIPVAILKLIEAAESQLPPY